MTSCPRAAIAVSDHPSIDASRCEGCGACATACPTGVFALRKSGHRILSALRTSRIDRFACSRHKGSQPAVVVPCLGCLDVGTLLYAARHWPRVVLASAPCGRCDSKAVLETVVRSVETANAILKAFGQTGRVSLSAREEPEAPPEVIGCSRRQFLAQVRSHATATGLEVAEAMGTDVLGPWLVQGRELGSTVDTHEMLVAMLLGLADSINVADGPRDLPLPMPAVGPGCDLCGICVAACPAKALETREDGDSFSLELQTLSCVACGLCVNLCPKQAVSLAGRMTTAHIKAGHRTRLHNLLKATCARCGQQVAQGSEAGLCRRCINEMETEESFERFLTPRLP